MARAALALALLALAGSALAQTKSTKAPTTKATVPANSTTVAETKPTETTVSATKPPAADGCCLDHPDKPDFPPEVAAQVCADLTALGPDRCKAVWQGVACVWATGEDCRGPRPCMRVGKKVVRNGVTVDVGECTGGCAARGQTCQAVYASQVVQGFGEVLIVKDCLCDTCAAKRSSMLVEVPTGRCEGNCNTVQLPRTCSAGVADNFDLSNGPEPSAPSAALQSGVLSQCSSGTQPGFDTFANDRCFGHTFSDCLQDGPCPLRRATLSLCLRAAQVSLTHTDSLILAVNGAPVWGLLLNTLFGATWTPGSTWCGTLDLANLPPSGGGVTSVIADIEAALSLDVVVQDDTAVDFADLSVVYEDCLTCRPALSVVSTLYTEAGAQQFEAVKDCDCVDAGKCQRHPLQKVFFPGTSFQTTVDVGQCLGACPRFQRCRPLEVAKKQLKGPEGVVDIAVVASCTCGRDIIALDPTKP